MTAAALRRRGSYETRIERLQTENSGLRRENEKLREKQQGCTPPPEFDQLYEELWDRAFGKGKKWVHESTGAGTFSLRRKTFHDLCRDERALDDIMALDKFFRALSLPVRKEAGRRSDVASWHKDIKRLIEAWKERYKSES